MTLTTQATDSETREVLLRVAGLTAGFGETTILEDINFEVYAGEIVAILGTSGSGKSTLFKHMIGLVAPMAGEVLIGGKNLVAAEGAERLEMLSRIGVMYQQGALFGSMTLLENVRLPMEEHTDLPPDATDIVALMKLKMVGLNNFAHHLPSELSGGMQKRGAIARAMVLDPQILFLDEPGSGLDPLTAAELDELILHLSRTLGITFVIVTHDLDSTRRVAERVIVLDRSRKGIAAIGDPESLRQSSSDPWVRQFLNRRVVAEAEADRSGAEV